MKIGKLIAFSLLGAALVAGMPFLIPAGPAQNLAAEGYLGSGQFVSAGALIFLAGFLTSLTPCVYPLIPITVGVFGARTASSRGRAVLLTLAYVVGMGMVFSLLGVVAARTGQAFGSVLGNPIIVVGLAIFLLLLAASMFGAFEVALPSGLTQRLSQVGGIGVGGAFLMGSVSGFLAAPCTGPVLTGLLAFVAKSQNAALGAGLLFVYALGIGVPFFVLGVFTVRLPKGGVWMEWVKSVFGIALVALAVTYLSEAFPLIRHTTDSFAASAGSRNGIILAAVFVAVGIAWGAVNRSFKAGLREASIKTGAVALVVLGIVLRMNVASAVNLSGGGPLSLTWQLNFDGSLQSLPIFQAAIAEAKRSRKPVLLDFFAEWCAACKELDRLTYTSPEVIREAQRFTRIKVDGTQENEGNESLYASYGIAGLPTIAFISGQGQLLETPRVLGFVKAEPLVRILKGID